MSYNYDTSNVWLNSGRFGIEIGVNEFDGKAELSAEEARALAAALIKAVEDQEKNSHG